MRLRVFRGPVSLFPTYRLTTTCGRLETPTRDRDTPGRSETPGLSMLWNFLIAPIPPGSTLEEAGKSISAFIVCGRQRAVWGVWRGLRTDRQSACVCRLGPSQTGRFFEGFPGFGEESARGAQCATRRNHVDVELPKTSLPPEQGGSSSRLLQSAFALVPPHTAPAVDGQTDDNEAFGKVSR